MTTNSVHAPTAAPAEKNYPSALAAAVLTALFGASIAWIVAFVAFGLALDDVSKSSWPMACAVLAGAAGYIGKWLSLKISKRI